MVKVMIVSLGGSVEPLKKSIQNHEPENLIFLASHTSTGLAGEILNILPFKPGVWYEITENPNIMLDCYQAARRCVDRAIKMNVNPEEVTVDYTGGTKVMTASLILATIGHPFHFNYVGGDARTKNGLGTVVDGHEKMFPEMNPWSIFAEEERRQVVILFNRRRFSAVLQIIDNCRMRELPADIADYFSCVYYISEGYLLWEQFNHEAAFRKISRGLEALYARQKSYPDPAIDVFINQVKQNKLFLKRLLDETNKMKILHPILVDDLMNNARRRMADKRYDDAAARIYRALELYGQVCFEQTARCSNSAVKPEIIPREIREQFVRKFGNDRNILKLPMTATFQYLKHKGHPAGINFFEKYNDIKNVQSNRNDSILAHGIKPVTENAISSIFTVVSQCTGFNNIFDLAALP
jgi:CRISPR-associated protein (TIGR02710 family)